MKLTLSILTSVATSVYAFAEESKWPEREIYSVCFEEQSSKVVVVRVASPPVEKAGGFYLQNGNFNPATALHCLTPADDEGRSWDSSPIKISKKQLAMSLPKDDKCLTSLSCALDQFHLGVFPLFQLGHQVIMVVGCNPAEVVKIAAAKEEGISLWDSAPTAVEGKLPIIFDKIVNKPENLAATFVGLLDIQSGTIQSITQIDGHGRIIWLGTSKVAIFQQSRKNTRWNVIEIATGKTLGTGIMPESAKWIIFDEKIKGWIPEPAAISIYPPDN